MDNLNRGVSRGFPLVELVLVMTIAGVLAAVMGPRMVDRTAFQTHGGAAEIRTALRYAQKLALAKNREVCVTTTAGDLTLMLNPITTLGAPCNANVLRPGADPVSEPTLIVVLPTGITPVPTFRFNGQGRPTSNAAVPIPLNAAVPLTVGSGGAPVTVLVEPETGYVH